MAAPQKFRSALNGFHREDVVAYIEYTNARHEAEVGKLREELEHLRRELVSLRETACAPAAGPDEELTEKCRHLEQENAALAEQNAQAAAEAEALRESLAQMTRERDDALMVQQTAVTRTEDELAAYRRAERAERLARQRANQICDQATGALADTAVQLDDAAAALGQAAEQAMDRIRPLQSAVTGSKQVLTDAAATLGAIRPPQTDE